MRYYDLDNGKVKGSYAVPQPGLNLVLLEEPPSEFYYWEGSVWVYDLPSGKVKRLIEIRSAAAAVILNKYPVWYQTNVATGIYPEAIGDAMKAGIASVIAESNRCEDLVDAATSEAEVSAVTPNWPAL